MVLQASCGWQTQPVDDRVGALVAEQIAYYRAHAPDYDDAYLGKDWDRCIEELPITGDMLELACGTGHWTPMLAARARSVTALDAAPEVLALARRRVRGLPVEFIEADLFAWQPPRRFDTVFFAFWLTHVPLPGSPPSGRWCVRLWRRAGRSASSTAAVRNVGASRYWPTRRRRPCVAGFATAASIGW
jgi:SAM-dependent methyltransferase